MHKLISSKWLNILFFNLFWIGCVAGRYSLLWLTAPLIVIYLILLIKTHTLILRQLALPIALGISIDTLLTITGVFIFDSTSWFIPIWLMVLWAAFITTLNLSLEFLNNSRLLMVLAGATGFPFSYAMGERLGAVTFGLGYPEVLAFLSVIWAVALPIMFYLAQGKNVVAHAEG